MNTMAGPFMETWVEDKARQRIVRDIAVIESEYPAHTGTALASGFRVPTSESCSILISVPSSRWFKPRMMWITNKNTVMNELNFYTLGSAGDASATLGGLWIGPRETQFIAFDGITLGQDLWVSCLVASTEVRITGILVNSGPE